METRRCLQCSSKRIQETVTAENNVMYSCPDCGYNGGRLFLDDGLAVLDHTSDGKPRHYSVAAVIIKGPNILLQNRRYFPYALSVPAGHLDKGENPQHCVIREVKEETNLKVDSLKKLFEKEIIGGCRRGVDLHHFHVFKCECSGTLIKDEESLDLIWTPIKELKKDKLTHATGIILQKLGYLSS